jgi:hypothetical protein
LPGVSTYNSQNLSLPGAAPSLNPDRLSYMPDRFCVPGGGYMLNPGNGIFSMNELSVMQFLMTIFANGYQIVKPFITMSPVGFVVHVKFASVGVANLAGVIIALQNIFTLSIPGGGVKVLFMVIEQCATFDRL